MSNGLHNNECLQGFRDIVQSDVIAEGCGSPLNESHVRKEPEPESEDVLVSNEKQLKSHDNDLEAGTYL